MPYVAFTTYKQDRVAFSRFAEFLNLPDDPGLRGGADLRLTDGTLQLQNVSFAYGQRSIVEDLSLTLEGGKTTALVGTSGAGKSTLVRRLLHLVKPDRRRVLVDGTDLADVSLDAYYRQVAYIPQDPPIFDGTVRENLVFDAKVAESVVQDALEKTGLVPLIARLPEGLETLVGERGVKLSRGEQQRLAFARLLVQQPKIVVMDEPTSSLDSITEEAVTQYLADFLRGRTVILIAHRLQTVEDADRILVLAEGRIRQDGDFASLIAVDGPFRKMWQAQVG